MTLRVLLVDDEPLARQRLARLLAEHTHYEIVAEAGNGQAALDWLRQHKADLVLLDIEAIHGYVATKRAPPRYYFLYGLR